MFRTLYSRILFFFISLSLGGIVLVSLAIQFGFEDSFRSYLEQKREDQIGRVIELLEKEYQQMGKITGESVAMVLHQQAMTENLYYKLNTPEQELVFDSTNMAGMMHGNESHFTLLSKSYSLEGENKKIGTLFVYFPEGYVNGEFEFLRQFHKYIIIASVAMIAISILLSFLFSNRLTFGLRRMRDAAVELKQHNLAVRIPSSGLQEEMLELSNAFNELAESLSRQEKLRKQFTGDLAHELRTPLATLRSQLEAFQDGIWEPTKDRLAQCHHELMRLVRLVDELEKLMAAENPQIQLWKESVEVKGLIHFLSDQFAPTYNQKGVELLIEEPSSEIWLQADRDRLIQIMANLLNNALKYTPQGGRVKLTAHKEEETIIFQIEDTGIGITEEDLPHVFERFYRGDKSRNRKTGGIGVGLSIVKALVLAHKGDIQIESAIDKGTSVIVRFPA
ncbi:MAG TPA: ATP-binding protein [Bacillota bacterium]|nr:ATP-binding protein [Bacillota bacterium]